MGTVQPDKEPTGLYTSTVPTSEAIHTHTSFDIIHPTITATIRATSSRTIYLIPTTGIPSEPTTTSPPAAVSTSATEVPSEPSTTSVLAFEKIPVPSTTSSAPAAPSALDYPSTPAASSSPTSSSASSSPVTTAPPPARIAFPTASSSSSTSTSSTSISPTTSTPSSSITTAKTPPPALPSDPSTEIFLVHPGTPWASWTPTQRKGVIAASVLSILALIAIVCAVIWTQRKRKRLIAAWGYGGSGIYTSGQGHRVRKKKSVMAMTQREDMKRVGVGDVERGSGLRARSTGRAVEGFGEEQEVGVRGRGSEVLSRDVEGGSGEGKGKERERSVKERERSVKEDEYEMSGGLLLSSRGSTGGSESQGKGWIRVVGKEGSP